MRAKFLAQGFTRSNSQALDHSSGAIAGVVSQHHHVHLDRSHAASELRKATVTLSYSIEIGACAKSALWQTAVYLLSEMHAAQLRPNMASRNAVVAACGQSHRWKRALALLAQMPSDRVRPDLASYGAAISACEKRRRWEWALGLLRELLERTDLVPNVIVYSAAISACEKGNKWEFALALLGEVRDTAMQIDAVVCNATLSALAKSKQWQRALELLQELPIFHVSPDVISYNASISAVDKESRWWDAMALLDQLRDSMMEPTVVSYNACISSLGRGRRWHDAIKLMRAMKETGPLPNEITFNACISAVGRGRQWTWSIDLLANMAQFSLQPNVIGCNAAILACLVNKQWQHGFGLLSEARKLRVVFDLSSYSRLLSECAQRGLVALEAWLFQDIGLMLSDAIALGKDVETAAENSAAMQLMLAGLAEEASLILLRSVANGRGDACAFRLLRVLQNGVSQSVLHHRRLGAAAKVSSRPRFHISPPKSELSIGALQQYTKELRLLRYVKKAASLGNPVSICRSIEAFGVSVLGSRGMWLKVVGKAKAQVLVNALRSAPFAVRSAGPTKRNANSVLEIGTYCGYSALWMAVSFPDIRIATLEVDPVHAVVAKNIIALAGLSHRVEVFVGHSKDILPEFVPGRQLGQYAPFAAVFMDQCGSRYHEDLATLENHALLEPGAVIIADNVLKPGAPHFLWYAMKHKEYDTKIFSVPEFAMPLDDWMSVTIFHTALSGLPEHSSVPPLEVLRLSFEADQARERARADHWTVAQPSAGSGRGMSFDEWAAFTQKMRDGLAQIGIEATHCASESESAALDSNG